jgi:uncharacterized repeat protein (TIGR01451 family)
LKLLFLQFAANLRGVCGTRHDIDKYLISFALQWAHPMMLSFPYIMTTRCPERAAAAFLCVFAITVIAHAQSGGDHIVTSVSAELAARGTDHGAPLPKLQVAERVVPGDVIVYTVEVRNAGQYAAESPIVIQAIPNHMMYLADSAVGPGVDVDFSIDGGRTFDAPENLKIAGSGLRATPADYTHIRWHLRNRLKPNSIAYVRYRAQVK